MGPELLWRLGLGWLVGKRHALLTTTTSDGVLRRSLIPFLFSGGLTFAPASGPWVDDLKPKPDVTIQASPGPKGVTGSVVDDPALAIEAATLARDRGVRHGDEWVVFRPTGRVTPEMVAPDLAWMWPALVAFLLVARWMRRD